MTKIEIRYATLQDAYMIASVHVASWQKIYRGLLPDSMLDALSISDRESEWRDLIIKNVKILVIEKDHQLVGFASIGPSRDKDIDQSQCGEISSLYLHPSFWHQGFGKKLLLIKK